MAAKLIWFSLFLTINADLLDILRRKTIRIDKFEGSCPGHKNAPVTVENIHITYANRLHMVSLDSVAKEDIKEGLKLRLFLKRCKSKEALDSCEKYQTITVNHLCDLLNAENTPWTPMLKLADPPMACPIRKGISSVKNGTFDGSAFAHLPVTGWYWIINANIVGEETNRLLMCCIVEAQIVPV